MQSYGFFGGTFGNVLSQWEQAGVFSYLLPFLLIFALIFGILQKLNLFNNRAVNGIIALAVGLMSLQFGFVSTFFANIFPRLGLGLAVVLGALILLGMFMDTNQTWIMFGIGAVVFVVVVWNSFDFGNTSWGFFVSQYWVSIIFGVIVIAIVIGMAFNPFEGYQRRNDNPLAKAINALAGSGKP